MKKIILISGLSLFVGIGISIGVSIFAFSTQDQAIINAVNKPKTQSLSVGNTNSTKIQKIFFEKELSGPYITKINDNGISCYLYTGNAGAALSCLK